MQIQTPSQDSTESFNQKDISLSSFHFPRKEMRILSFTGILFLCLLGIAISFPGGHSHLKHARSLEETQTFTFYLDKHSEKWSIPTSLFDSSYVSFSAVLSGGAALPEWLVLNSVDRSFTISPRKDNTQNAVIELTGSTASGSQLKKTITIVTRNGRYVLQVTKDDTFIRENAIELQGQVLSNGDMLLAYSTSGSNSKVYLSSFNENAVAVSGEVPVKSDQGNIQLTPQIAVLKNGEVLTTWSHIEDDGKEYPYAKIGDTVVRLSTQYVALSSCVIVPLTNGNALIIWNSLDVLNLARMLRGVILDNTANVVESDFEIEGTTNKQPPKTLVLNSGNILIAWNTGSAASILSAYGMVLSPTRDIVNDLFNLDEGRTNNALLDMLNLSTGEVLLVWRDKNSDKNKIIISLYDPKPNTLYDPADIPTNQEFGTAAAKAIVMPGDKILITWVRENNDKQIWGKVIQLDLVTISSSSTTTYITLQEDFLIFEGIGYNIYFPQLHQYSSDQVLFSWSMPPGKDMSLQTFFSVINLNGRIDVPPFQVTNDDGAGTDGQLMMLPSGKIGFAWSSSVEVAIDTWRTKLYLKVFNKQTLMNTAPEVVKTIPTQKLTVGQQLSLNLIDGTFIDYDNDPLAYNVHLPPNTSLSYDKSTGILSGSITEPKSLEVSVEAADKYRMKAAQSFQIIVEKKGGMLMILSLFYLTIFCLFTIL